MSTQTRATPPRPPWLLRGGGECPTSRPRGAHCRAPGAAVPPCIAVPRRGCGFRSTASGWVGATVLQSSGCRCPREFGDLERHRAVVDTAQAPCSIDQFNRHGATTDRDRRASYGGPHAGARRRPARPLAATSRCGHGFGRASRRRRRAGRSADSGSFRRPVACAMSWCLARQAVQASGQLGSRVLKRVEPAVTQTL